MNRSWLVVVSLLLGLVAAPAFAAEQGAADSARESDDDKYPLTFSVGLSYPLIFSGSLGALVPLGDPGKDNESGIPVALRVDGELGLGGGIASLGLFFLAGSGYNSPAVSLKAALLHTWPWQSMERSNRTYGGAVVELSIPAHILPTKLGLGAFRDTQPINNRREELYYFFAGFGW